MRSKQSAPRVEFEETDKSPVLQAEAGMAPSRSCDFLTEFLQEFRAGLLLPAYFALEAWRRLS